MSNPYYHCVSSAKRFGGVPEDYAELHEWFDRGKASQPNYKHRCLSHHSQGIFDAMQVFGQTLTISTGAKVPVQPHWRAVYPWGPGVHPNPSGLDEVAPIQEMGVPMRTTSV